MNNLDSILKSGDITLLTKVSMVKATVFPAVIYRCESWTIKKAEYWRIDAFELWCWRRLFRDPWTARRSNQSILKEIWGNHVLLLPQECLLEFNLTHSLFLACSSLCPWVRSSDMSALARYCSACRTNSLILKDLSLQLSRDYLQTSRRTLNPRVLISVLLYCS